MSKFSKCIVASLLLATILTIVESLLGIKGPGIFTANYGMTIAVIALQLVCEKKR